MVLVEVIKEGEIVRMSELQARQEDLFVLRKVIEPESEQISTDPSFIRKVDESARDMSKSKTKLDEWKTKNFSYKRNNVLNELVSNFNWEISKARKRRNMTRKMLADSAGTPEDTIKMIEMGELPRDDFILISRIESALGINLRKSKPQDVNMASLQKSPHNVPSNGSVSHSKPSWVERREKKEKETRDRENAAQNLVGGDIELIE